MKKIDSLALSNSITKEELLKYNYIYNYSTAICNNTVYATEVTDSLYIQIMLMNVTRNFKYSV